MAEHFIVALARTRTHANVANNSEQKKNSDHLIKIRLTTRQKINTSSENLNTIQII
jgi:hypothetical protein